MLLSKVYAVLFAAAASAQQLSSQLTQIKDFGPNPRNVSMYIYVPKNLTAKPPILVVPHWCHGTAQDAFRGRPYASLGDQYGFISIYPDSPNKADQCWDVSSKQSLTHNGGGDALGIVSMVRWALEKYGGDKNRVFVTGTSSGAMMTNVLIGSYPDVFAAGSAWAGVPFGCYAADGFGVWSDDCAKGKIIKNGTEWAAIVKAAYPGYNSFRPKIQVFHGTKDDILFPQNLKEEIKQWTAVLGLSSTPTSTTPNTPLKGWTRYRYGTTFEAYEAEGVTHDIPNQADVVMEWFDLKCKGTGCYSRKSGYRTSV
ncbi:carbohydrate esterase family 1 protein [Aaosphaeria arxii CBS 175.79]|uniref:Carboxylic ester hydrolase n=1 Tax=Aaosphaeria arxii CBS 175.79 TaxID=1450172 RepID=A0A6A5Y8E9_9PLEO|nr:carbohydrate esterase family 1 protein [Aaosphaeria arxii CBS 175.79]KAF2021287.1 carbohydrate esterase family 1 protein [Aaosphaeria arxii CBS 175.79]